MNNMKKSLLICTSFFLLVGLILMESCSSKSDPSPATPSATEQTKAILTSSGGWRMQSATVDGTDQTTVYKGLTINFTDSGFTTSNGGVVWPVSGTWSFTDESGTAIKRNDGLVVTIVAAEISKLVLKLIWTTTTFGPGKVSSLKGETTFTFSK
jgi:hypothetical protein